MNGYDVYEGDSYGYDIVHYPGRTIEELMKLCNKIPSAIGFNSLGYIKYRADNRIVLPNCTLYIKRNKCPNLLEKKKKLIQDTCGRYKSDLTFTVTTCKRLDRFIQTMDMFILNCKDVYVIDEWICIDDNSSDEDRAKMKELYPWFKFVLKGPDKRGHQISINMLFSMVKTKYALQFEDDWICYQPIYIVDYLKMLKRKEFDHIILRWIGGKHKLHGNVKGYNIYKYIYNPGHHIKPKENKKYDEEQGFVTDIVGDNNSHWWWPGFTLNPSIYNIRMCQNIGRINEDIPTELFEYDFAMKCYNAGYKVGMTNLNIHHTGAVSSYSLNNTHRYYDAVLTKN